MTDYNRQYRRIDKNITLLYCVADARPAQWDMSIAENISAGGVKFRALSDLKLKDKIVQLRIKIPALAPHVLEVEGMVVNVEPLAYGKLSEVCVKFINLSEINTKNLSVVEGMIDSQEIKDAQNPEDKI